MPVDSRSPANQGAWARVQKVRDFLALNVDRYVSRLPGHSEEAFELYKKRAYYLPAVGRTLDGFAGMVLNPSPTVQNVPEAFDAYLDDLTYDGEPWQRVTQTVVEEVLTSGRCVVVVDYPQAEVDETMTVARAEALGLRAYARVYDFDTVLDVRCSSRGGEKYTEHIRLLETYTEPDPLDEFAVKEHAQVRVLDFDEAGHYRVRVFRKASGGDGEWVEHSSVTPRLNGSPLDEIPAVVFGPSTLDASTLAMPPLYELVSISESHLNDSADRQWALAWCGAPTLVISGTISNEGPIKLGSSEGIQLGEGGSAILLQMGAEAVGALRQSLEDKERHMAMIGARMLASNGSSQISTETARLERAGEHSVLAAVANTVADGMTRVLRNLGRWANIDAEKVRVVLNTDFLPTGLQPGELTEWVQALQAGALPSSMFLERLKSRGVVDPSYTEEAYRSDLQDTRDAGLALSLDMPVDDGENEDDEQSE